MRHTTAACAVAITAECAESPLMKGRLKAACGHSSAPATSCLVCCVGQSGGPAPPAPSWLLRAYQVLSCNVDFRALAVPLGRRATFSSFIAPPPASEAGAPRRWTGQAARRPSSSAPAVAHDGSPWTAAWAAPCGECFLRRCTCAGGEGRKIQCTHGTQTWACVSRGCKLAAEAARLVAGSICGCSVGISAHRWWCPGRRAGPPRGVHGPGALVGRRPALHAMQASATSALTKQ